MIYHVGDGVACLNYELDSMVRDVYDRSNGLEKKDIYESLLTVLGLNFGKEGPTEDLSHGLPTETVAFEVSKAKAFSDGSLVVPILFLKDKSILDAIKAAFAGGANKVSIFQYKRDFEDLLRKISQYLPSQ